MQIQTVGILSPGDMGQAIASVLSQNGMRTVAALDDRSDRTRQLAQEGKIEDIGSLKRLVAESDVLLSVLVPSVAKQAAEQAAILSTMLFLWSRLKIVVEPTGALAAAAVERNLVKSDRAL